MKGIKPGLPLVFIDSVHFVNNFLDNLVKDLGENRIYYLSQKFSANVLDLFKTIGLFPYDYWDIFQKFKEGLPSKDKFRDILANCGISDKNYEHVLNVWKRIKL